MLNNGKSFSVSILFMIFIKCRSFVVERSSPLKSLRINKELTNSQGFWQNMKLYQR